MLCIVVLGADVKGEKMYHCVLSSQLPINCFRHFCCRMYCSATK